jgi:hypothetical protein
LCSCSDFINRRARPMRLLSKASNIGGLSHE